MNKCKVEILETAQTEIEEIISIYVRLAGAANSRRFMDKLYNAFEQLSAFPLSGPPIPDKELRLAGYRLIVVDDYLCIYRIMENIVYIYHVVHGCTNYPQLFRENK